MTRRALAGLLVMLLGAALLGAPLAYAQADDWKAMRFAGQLGERYDGMLVARDPAAAATAARINAARLAIYQKRATETGAPVDQVGRVYFKENLPQLPPGTWLLLEDGTWTRK